MSQSELSEHAALQNWRVIAYGAVVSAMFLSGAVLGWALTPGVTKMESCSKACVGKMKAFTERVPAQWGHLKVDGEFLGMKTKEEQNIWMDEVPAKCDCQ